MISNPNYINLQEKRDFGQVINATLSFFRQNIKSMMKDLIFLAGPFFILTGVLTAMNQNHASRLGTGPLALLFNFEHTLSMLCSLVGYTLVFVIVGNYILNYKENEGREWDKKTISDNIKKDVIKEFFTILAYSFLVGLAFLLLVIPGIYFSVALSLVLIIRVLNKNASLGEAIKESRRLIKGNWWKSFGLFFVVTLIATIFSLVIMIPGLITTSLVTFNSIRHAESDQYHFLNIVFMGLGSFGYVFTMPIFIIMLAIYYYSLKETKDATGLNEKIDMIDRVEIPAVNSNESAS